MTACLAHRHAWASADQQPMGHQDPGITLVLAGSSQRRPIPTRSTFGTGILVINLRTAGRPIFHRPGISTRAGNRHITTPWKK